MKGKACKVCNLADSNNSYHTGGGGGGGGRGRVGNLPEENVFIIWPLEPFSKLKTKLCKYLTLTKIEISMTCGCKVYENKTKIGHEQWPQLKMKFLLAY